MDMILYILIPLIIVVLVIVYFRMSASAEKSDAPADPYRNGLRQMLDHEYPGALESFRDEVNRDTDNVDAYIRLGVIYRETGSVQKAVRIHSDLTRRRGIDDAYQLRIWKELATDYLKLGNESRAIAAYEKVLTINASCVKVLKALTPLLEKAERWGDAFNRLQKLVEITGNHAPAHLALLRTQEARQQFQAGDGKKGRLLCKDALKIDPKCAPAYFLIGQSYINEDRAKEGISFWEKLVQEVPEKSSFIFNRLEEALFKTNQFTKVEYIYRNLINRSPDVPEAYMGLARYHEKKGELDQAIEVCREGLNQTDDNIWLTRQLIHVFHRKGDQQAIIDHTMNVVDRYLGSDVRYKCVHCGSVASELLWYCPTCFHWASYVVDEPGHDRGQIDAAGS